MLVSFASRRKEKYLKIERDLWRVQRNFASDQYVCFTHGLYSFKRHGSNADVYRFINLPLPSSLIIKNEQLTARSCSSTLFRVSFTFLISSSVINKICKFQMCFSVKLHVVLQIKLITMNRLKNKLENGPKN